MQFLQPRSQAPGYEVAVFVPCRIAVSFLLLAVLVALWYTDSALITINNKKAGENVGEMVNCNINVQQRRENCETERERMRVAKPGCGKVYGYAKDGVFPELPLP